MKNISATIITYNEEKNIARCIHNLQFICNEIIVLDSYSTDNTIKIAKKLGAKVYLQKFLGDGLQKKKSADLAQNDWILSIDADEILAENALQMIKNLDLQDSKIGYAFRRKNFLGNQWLKSLYPDYKIRLYHRKVSYYKDSMIHSAVVSPVKKKLAVDIIHSTFENYTDWITKINFYSSKESYYKISLRKGKAVSYGTIIAHVLVTFFKIFFLKGGIFRGKNGLIVSVTLSFHTFAKYIKMLEIQENKSKKKN